MTDTEKKIREIFEETLPKMTEAELHDLLMVGHGMAMFVQTRQKPEEPKKAG